MSVTIEIHKAYQDFDKLAHQANNMHEIPYLSDPQCNLVSGDQLDRFLVQVGSVAYFASRAALDDEPKREEFYNIFIRIIQMVCDQCMRISKTRCNFQKGMQAKIEEMQREFQNNQQIHEFLSQILNRINRNIQIAAQC